MTAQTGKILFLIAGNAGHGKDSFARSLTLVLSKWCEVYTTSFAYGIKKILHDNYNVPWSVMNGDKNLKESTYVHIGNTKTPVTVRCALQKIGQFHRELFGPTCWAASALARCSSATGSKVCVITDARHPTEELHWMTEQARSLGFLVVSVRLRRKDVPVNVDHLSESLIFAEPDETFSFVVENDSSMEHLDRVAYQIACAAVMMHKSGKSRIRRSDGVYVVRQSVSDSNYEPLLQACDAQLLAGPHDNVEKISFDLLVGAAVD